MNNTRPCVIPALVYKDNRAALQWLREAFAFEVSEVLTDENNHILHAEMRYADGLIMVGSEWADWTKSPLSAQGINTQRVFVQLAAGIDEHCERARKAGAVIEREPADQFYGERSYIAVDLEGHHWTFSQTIRTVSLEEMQRATGMKLSHGNV